MSSRRTKIIATIGPASSDPAVLARMIRGGMDVARLNFSHGTYRDHSRAIRHIRALSKRIGKHVGLLLDLQGPRLRVGELDGGVAQLRAGAEVILTNRRGKGNARWVWRCRIETSPLRARRVVLEVDAGQPPLASREDLVAVHLVVAPRLVQDAIHLQAAHRLRRHVDDVVAERERGPVGLEVRLLGQ